MYILAKNGTSLINLDLVTNIFLDDKDNCIKIIAGNPSKIYHVKKFEHKAEAEKYFKRLTGAIEHIGE